MVRVKVGDENRLRFPIEVLPFSQVDKKNTVYQNPGMAGMIGRGMIYFSACSQDRDLHRLILNARKMPTNRSVFVGEEDIDVSVQNGVATLEGEVDSMMELDQAIKDAFDGGARRVINRLDIDDQPDYYKDLLPVALLDHLAVLAAIMVMNRAFTPFIRCSSCWPVR